MKHKRVVMTGLLLVFFLQSMENGSGNLFSMQTSSNANNQQSNTSSTAAGWSFLSMLGLSKNSQTGIPQTGRLRPEDVFPMASDQSTTGLCPQSAYRINSTIRETNLDEVYNARCAATSLLNTPSNAPVSPPLYFSPQNHLPSYESATGQTSSLESCVQVLQNSPSVPLARQASTSSNNLQNDLGQEQSRRDNVSSVITEAPRSQEISFPVLLSAGEAKDNNNIETRSDVAVDSASPNVTNDSLKCMTVACCLCNCFGYFKRRA